ncbi:MAG: metal-dependent hydrolase [Deltaproteobacteria bacterium HGW-Deltaproteobacteria-8]|jgi:L-ascorbate metabolism protein UlaG (beta-lactamase superfamily)|nr:MAG: metal-dependent hydrolase [Deltaproteobacteria bacterium HGW-Deltaproteobacteria-8]
MLLTWFGHSNFRLEEDGLTIVVDPFFEGNSKAPCGWQSLDKVDAVLVTHDHGDHVGQAAEICQATGATLVCLFDTVPKMKGLGVPGEQILGMNLGGTLEVAGLRVKMVQAFHSSATGSPAGFILTFPGGFCAYHSGDTALFSDMKLFRRFFDIDLAMLPMGGWFTMDAVEAAVACSFLNCRNVAPMHWGTFPILAQDTDAFGAALKEHAPETRLLGLTPGIPAEVA